MLPWYWSILLVYMHSHVFCSFTGLGRWNALVSVVNFQSCYCMGFCIITYFSVLIIKLQKVLPGYFLFKGKKKRLKLLNVKSSISNCRESGWKQSFFFAGLQIFYYCDCLPTCFFSYLCFLQIATLSSSFQAILSNTIWKPVVFSFHPIFSVF